MVDSVPIHCVSAWLLWAASMLEVNDVFALLLFNAYLAHSQRVLEWS